MNLSTEDSLNPKLAFFDELQIQLIARQRIELAHTLIPQIWLKDQVHIAIHQGTVSAFPMSPKPKKSNGEILGNVKGP